MLLAAGLGERMLPLTRRIPKPAIPVLGRPMIIQVLRQLARQGVRFVVMNLHHLPESLQTLLGNGTELGLDVLQYSNEEQILGTSGGIHHAAKYLRDGDTILVRNADFLADIDLAAATAAHVASGCLATMVLAQWRPGYTPIEVDRAGRVVSIGGEPRALPQDIAGRYLFTGLHLIEPEVLDLIPQNGPSDMVRDVYLHLASDGSIASYVHSGFWWEFGSLRNFLEGSLQLLSMRTEERIHIAETDPIRCVGTARVAVGAGADFHGGVELVGRVALGFASFVGEGAVLEDSVVMAEGWIGPGSKLTRVIVAPEAEVPAGFEIQHALLCPDPEPELELPATMERHHGLLIRRFGGEKTENS